MILYVATTNAGKLREFRHAAESAGVTVEPLPGLKSLAAPEETGTTFEANAILKACFYSGQVDPGIFVIAEDSGLEVDLLGGEPGVYSARYAGPEATDAANNDLVRVRLAGRESAARYVCAIALARAGQVLRTFHGTVEGKIIPVERGSGGFGYDPMFFYPPLGRTFGEATADEKAGVSHRAMAARDLFAYLRSTCSASIEGSRS